jgi:hypothetical protein
MAIAVCLGTTALLANNVRAARHVPSADAQLNVDGAFRDGLYVGRFAAQHGGPEHPPIGRWSTDRDRALFVAGFHRGYNNSLASSEPGRQNISE